MKRFVLILALAGAAVFPIAAQQAPSKTRATVETLASERFEGRLAGSTGERLASDYIAAQLRKIGAKPLPGQTDFLLPFEFTAGSRDRGSTISLANESRSARALSFSDDGDVSGPVVFAGYGIVVPDG